MLLNKSLIFVFKTGCNSAIYLHNVSLEKAEKALFEYDMEGLLPSNVTIANDDCAHKVVMCARSTFFKTGDYNSVT